MSYTPFADGDPLADIRAELNTALALATPVITSVSISGGDFLVTTLDAAGKSSIEIHLSGVECDTDDVSLRLTTYHGGVEETGTNYEGVARSVSGGSGATNFVNSGSSAFLSLFVSGTGWGLGNAAGEDLSGRITLMFPDADSEDVAVVWQLHFDGAGGSPVAVNGAGKIKNTGKITGFRLNTSTGNIDAGSCKAIARG